MHKLRLVKADLLLEFEDFQVVFDFEPSVSSDLSKLSPWELLL